MSVSLLTFQEVKCYPFNIAAGLPGSLRTAPFSTDPLSTPT
jgi:hypothetical protein